MKIVVLDGYTLNPGDLDWDGLKTKGELIVYERTNSEPSKVVEAIGNAEIVFTNKTLLPRVVLEKLPSVKYIGVLATGYNVVDVAAAKEYGITVTNVPAYSTKAVAQFTMGLLLEMCHHFGDHSAEVYQGAWSRSPDFCFWNSPLVELDGKTMGIIGFGSIGQAVARLAQAFEIKVLVHSRTAKPEFESETLKFVSLDELYRDADIVSLHCPLTPDTEGLINCESIGQMKEGVMIINTSRGPIIVEADLRDALNSGKVAYAAVDVVSAEPISGENPLLAAENCIITPHIAWAPKEARLRLMAVAIENLTQFLEGNSVNVVRG